MKIEITTKERVKQGPVKDAIKEYERRLSRYCKVKLRVVRNTQKDIKGKPYIIKVCKEGATISSEELADKVSSLGVGGQSHIIFILGDNSIEKADFNFSLSKMDIDKDLILIILYEQLYRAFSIINKTPYHK